MLAQAMQLMQLKNYVRLQGSMLKNLLAAPILPGAESRLQCIE